MTELLADDPASSEHRNTCEPSSVGLALLTVINDILDFPRSRRANSTSIRSVPAGGLSRRRTASCARPGSRERLELTQEVAGRRFRTTSRAIRAAFADRVKPGGHAIKSPKHGEVAMQVRWSTAVEDAAGAPRIRPRYRHWIPAEKHALIFRVLLPQADGSTTRERRTGLGLSISKRLFR